jgi:hypothetical protein
MIKILRMRNWILDKLILLKVKRNHFKNKLQRIKQKYKSDNPDNPNNPDNPDNLDNLTA